LAHYDRLLSESEGGAKKILSLWVHCLRSDTGGGCSGEFDWTQSGEADVSSEPTEMLGEQMESQLAVAEANGMFEDADE